MSDLSAYDNNEAIPILPDTVPISMPELPPKRILTTMQEFKAVSDETRSHILGLIQQQPATAKQIADRLHATPGAIGHHLHLLEAAGLAQVVARRFIRGTVANYYARTARIFQFDFPHEIRGDNPKNSFSQRMAMRVLDELVNLGMKEEDDLYGHTAFLHPRLSPERANVYRQRLSELIDDIIHEAPEPSGQVYSIFIGMFTSPDYLQLEGSTAVADTEQKDG